MFPIQKWDDIQPKCTVHIDFAKKEYSVHLTNSPAAELQLLGLTPEQCGTLTIKEGETTRPVQKGRAFGFYAVGIRHEFVHRHDKLIRSSYIRTGVYESMFRIDDACRLQSGKMWITFGGPVSVTRMLNLLTMGRGITFISADGVSYNSPLTKWQMHFGSYRKGYTIREAVGGTTTEEALMIMHIADSEPAEPPPRDEDQIEQD